MLCSFTNKESSFRIQFWLLIIYIKIFEKELYLTEGSRYLINYLHSGMNMFRGEAIGHIEEENE